MQFNCKWVSWIGCKARFSLRSAPQPQLGMSTLTACRVATHKPGRKQPSGSLVNCAGWAKKTTSFLEEDQNNWFVCPSIRGNTWNSHLCLYSYARILCILKLINHSKRSNVDALLGLWRRKPGYVNHFRDKLIYVLAGKSYEICSSPPTKFNSGFMLFLLTFATWFKMNS